MKRRYALASVVVVCLSCSDAAHESVTLGFSAEINAEKDSRFAMIAQVVSDSCNVIVYDHEMHKVARITPVSRDITFHGSYGDGPGEFRHIRGLVRAQHGQVLLQDWVRRRMVSVDLATGASSGTGSPEELTNFGLVGKIRMLADGSMVDYWLGDGMTTIAISPAELVSRPLIAHLDRSGKWMGVGWGIAEPASQQNTVRLHLALQAGDVAVLADTLYVLRSPLGRVELFSIAQPSANPARVIRLASYFKAPEPREQALRQQDSYVVAPAIAAAMAVAPNGRIVVIAYANDPTRIQDERLDVYSSDGQRVASYGLGVKQTRSVSVLADGMVSLLANADADSLTMRSVLFFDVPETRTTNGPGCGWKTSPWAPAR